MVACGRVKRNRKVGCLKNAIQSDGEKGRKTDKLWLRAEKKAVKGIH